MGMATTNTFSRIQAWSGKLQGLTPQFGNHNSVEYGGVLLLLPALLSQGLMTACETHQIKEGYYTTETIILIVAFMALCRIKNPQQLSQCKSGQLGMLLGVPQGSGFTLQSFFSLVSLSGG